MTVIGIDPGIDRVGVGIIEYVNNKYNLLFQQLIHTDKSLTTPQRLVGIYEQLQEILSNWKQIEAASVEKLFFCKNVTNAITVAQARGVICLA
ncbi:MAG: crossover junction endodeoxyribonuclease RuvC, partial [Spirochaetales bacterium]|nr:crossover junction endodeoxyribonuclease RuvC [Spirochaetales bacterium]